MRLRRWPVPALRLRFWCERAGTGASPCSSAAGPACRRWSGPLCPRPRSWMGRQYTQRWRAGRTRRGTPRPSASPLCLSPLCWWDETKDFFYVNTTQMSQRSPHNQKHTTVTPNDSYAAVKYQHFYSNMWPTDLMAHTNMVKLQLVCMIICFISVTISETTMQWMNT